MLITHRLLPGSLLSGSTEDPAKGIVMQVGLSGVVLAPRFLLGWPLCQALNGGALVTPCSCLLLVFCPLVTGGILVRGAAGFHAPGLLSGLGVSLLLEQMLSAPKASITSGGRSVVVEASDSTAWTFKCRWPFWKWCWSPALIVGVSASDDFGDGSKIRSTHS